MRFFFLLGFLYGTSTCFLAIVPVEKETCDSSLLYMQTYIFCNGKWPSNAVFEKKNVEKIQNTTANFNSVTFSRNTLLKFQIIQKLTIYGHVLVVLSLCVKACKGNAFARLWGVLAPLGNTHRCSCAMQLYSCAFLFYLVI